MKLLDLFQVEQTRLPFWGTPQYTKDGMFWFTLMFGFFGMHHLYFRSPQTAVACFALNCVTLGYWWMYDVVQLRTGTTEGLNATGLDTPLGPMGIAQGMFAEAEQLKQAAEAAAAGGNNGDSKSPSPTYTLFYYLLLPVFTAGAIALAGDIPNAVTRVLYMLPILLIFFLPVVNVLFFLNLPAWAYDMYRAFLTPKTLFEKGHSRFMPFTWLGFDVDGHSPNLQIPVATEKPCPPRSFFESLTGIFMNLMSMGLPFLRIVVPQLAMTIEKGIAAGQAAADKVKKGVEVAGAAVQVAQQVPAAVAGIASKVSPEALKSEVQARVAAASTAPSVPISPGANKENGDPLSVESVSMQQRGGALPMLHSQDDGTNMLLSGITVTALLGILAGGFLITGVRSLDDNPPEQSSILDDAPPKPRAV